MERIVQNGFFVSLQLAMVSNEEEREERDDKENDNGDNNYFEE